MSDLNEAAIVRAWLLNALKITGLKATPFAKGADLAPSTILRALDPESVTTLDVRSIRKIVEKYGIAAPSLLSGDLPGNVVRFPGMAEPELAPIERDTTFAGASLTPTQGVFRVATRALDLAGLLPGDSLLADSAVHPRARDVVVAQVIDPRTGEAETVIRLYDPPYLLTDSADPDAKRKPAPVDGDLVSIWGVVIAAMRIRAP